MIVFVCSPYGGLASNYLKARLAMKYVALNGHVPVAPHVMLHGILDDADPFHRTAGREMGLKLLKISDEIWIFNEGKNSSISAGMSDEIIAADIPKAYIMKSWDQIEAFVKDAQR